MGGRGMFVSVLVALVAGCAFLRQSTWQRKIAVVLVVLVSSIVGLASVPKPRLDHFGRLQELLNISLPTPEQRAALWAMNFELGIPGRALNDTVAVRVELYREAVELFLRKPVTGAGTGRFGLESCCFAESIALTTPHSTVLHVLSELGVSGAAPFVVLNLMLLGIAWRVIRVQSSDPTLHLACVVAAAWVYIVIYDQISANYLSSLRYYLFSGLLVTLYVVYRREKMSFAFLCHNAVVRKKLSHADQNFFRSRCCNVYGSYSISGARDRT